MDVSSRNFKKYRKVSTRKKNLQLHSWGIIKFSGRQDSDLGEFGMTSQKKDHFILILLCFIFWVGKLYSEHIWGNKIWNMEFKKIWVLRNQKSVLWFKEGHCSDRNTYPWEECSRALFPPSLMLPCSCLHCAFSVCIIMYYARSLKSPVRSDWMRTSGERMMARCWRKTPRTVETHCWTLGEINFLSGVVSSFCVLQIERQSSKQQRYQQEDKDMKCWGWGGGTAKEQSGHQESCTSHVKCGCLTVENLSTRVTAVNIPWS